MILRDVDERLQISVPPEAHTLNGFRAWAASPSFPENGSISLIEGELLIDRSPERMGSHNKAKAHIAAVLGIFVDEQDLGDFYIDGAWLTHDGAELSTEPDAVFVRNETWDSGQVQIVPRPEGDDGIELRGTPDWVLEVVSPTSVRKDTQLLVASYHRAGIPEYWLIDARNEPIQFAIFVREKTGYRVSPSQDGWVTSPVFARQFRLECERRGVGRWRYKLHVREIPTS
jgi:Uma2 family endonuclease